MKKIIIFGGSGFIGKHATTYFLNKGCEVVVVSRTKKAEQHSTVLWITWKDLQNDVSVLERATAFINLAGESIQQYWTPKNKKAILESRIKTTNRITSMVEKLKQKPKVMINGSAIGIYGMSETAIFDEESRGNGTDFLAQVVIEWEKAADRLSAYTRTIKLRMGVVLSMQGGALPKLVLPYKLWIGGRIGSGKQWMSWIHIADLLHLIDFCIENERIKDVINATAPNPVTNEQFGNALAHILNRPNFFHVPAFLLRWVFKEMSQLILKGQKVLPTKALNNGFTFTYPTIDVALTNLLK